MSFSSVPARFPASALRDYVVASQGHTPIERVLIANNGIAAVKEIRSIRKWSYDTFDDECLVKFIVMVRRFLSIPQYNGLIYLRQATPEDLQHNADYIRMADHYVEVPGGANNHNYANVDLIVDIAQRCGAHAVWAGWGHASENPKLPEKLKEHNIVFIGPSGFAMRSLGDKISSTIVAQSAGVPTMPWSGDGLTTDTRTPEGYITVPEQTCLRACVSNVQEAVECANRLGYPLMIKASEGGGGKGIRKVIDPGNFSSAFTQVSNEVPGSPIFLMKLAINARHLEVQLLADEHGNVISLFGRDCSVQRRHQKIIEEAPVTIANESLFEQMEMSAVRLAKIVGYVNAGTVEFLYDLEHHSYYFLELNPRLQVEHPTTEMVSGVNIPAAQLQVAMGIPLHRIRDIRMLYGLQPQTTSTIDFHFENPISRTVQRKPTPRGHVIACRITAENPDAGFKPSGGNLMELNFRSSTNVWGYFSVSASGGLHEYADSQFGHIFAYGTDRLQSRRSMIMALKELSIRGDFRTTIEYLIKLLETEEFTENRFNTAWLDGLIERNVKPEKPDLWVSVVCGSVCKAWSMYESTITMWKNALDKGQIPSLATLKTDFDVDIVLDHVRYAICVSMRGPERFSVMLRNICAQPVEVLARPLSDGGVLVTMDMLSYVVYSKEEVQGNRLNINGKTLVLENESDPTKLRSPSPGKLVRWLIRDGKHVQAGKCYAEVEVMKMVMPLVTTESGRLTHLRQEGTPIQAGDLLGTLVLDDPSKVRASTLYTGTIPHFHNHSAQSSKPHQVFNELTSILDLTLKGYRSNQNIGETIDLFFAMVQNTEIPRGEAFEILSTLSGRIPMSLDTTLLQLLDKNLNIFPAKAALEMIHEHCVQAVREGINNIYTVIHPLEILCNTHKDGMSAFECELVGSFIQQYVNVESLFCTSKLQKTEDVLLSIRTAYKDSDYLVQLVLSHSKVQLKNELLSALLDRVVRRPYYSRHASFIAALKALADLSTNGSAAISLKARETLLQLQQPSAIDRAQAVADILSRIARNDTGPVHQQQDALDELVYANYSLFDVLPIFFYDSNICIREVALEAYIRRAYQAYDVYETTARRVRAVSNSDNKFIIGDDEWSDVDDNDSESGSGWGSSRGASPAPSAIITDVAIIEWSFRFPLYDDQDSEMVTSVTSPSEAGILSHKYRNVSVSDFTLTVQKGEEVPVRRGVMCAVDSVAIVQSYMDALLDGLSKRRDSQTEPWNVMNICIRRTMDSTTDDNITADELGAVIRPFTDKLRARGVRRVTFMIYKRGQYPCYFTFRERSSYNEDIAIRHIEPSHAFHLELKRLANFAITPVPTFNRSIHVYYAVGHQNPADCRFFVTAIVQPNKTMAEISTLEYLISESDRLLASIFDAVEIASATYRNTDCNHLFINFVPHFHIHSTQVESSFKGFIQRHGRRFLKLRLTTAEIRFLIVDPDKKSTSQSNLSLSNVAFQPTKHDPAALPTPYRFLITNVCGVVKFETYREIKDCTGRTIMQSITGNGPLHNMDVALSYPIKEKIQPKRYRAHLMGTTYVYDFIELFREAVSAQWARYASTHLEDLLQQPNILITAQELILDADDQLQYINRQAGSNTCGMVAWLLEMYTPECPTGRTVVVIANDITFAIGSFGPAEDRLFYRASELARRLGVPRIYISANSGARIGLADEVLPLYRVAWIDEKDKSRGYRYLYLTPEDYNRLNSNELKSVIAVEVIEDDGEHRMKITDIIGLKDGLGVENLRGSGLIAGESSQAYEDIFTVTLVACRSVGIGAYLVRLGQRTVQTEGQPIILTGAAALNKVLGREVYTSNLQLGGTQIMHMNGVAHLTCVDNIQGIHQIVNWLSYVRPRRNDPLPIVNLSSTWDTVERDIGFVPTKTPYDPRHMLAGCYEDEDEDIEDNKSEHRRQWISGFFDRGSFIETLAGWSKSVVVGRARLGGIPMGVIATETRTMESHIPADPANPSSEEQLVMEAAGVWTPNSSFKTAQAINDFNKGEQLPLIIFANWRGFSGGQRDMYDAILKYGSHIIDALRAYKQPVFIYIMPYGELRGGAWVVLDPTINSDKMEMYASDQSRGGVLEAEGIVEIKYRQPQISAAMERLDVIYSELKQRLSNTSLDAEQRHALQVKCDTRERELYPAFYQVALQIADLHDTPGRMLAKNTISGVIVWSSTRRYFYWRLRRRLAEDELQSRIKRARSLDTSVALHSSPTSLSTSMAMCTPVDERKESSRLLEQWYHEDGHSGVFSEDDRSVVDWFEQSTEQNNRRIATIESEQLTSLLTRLMRERPEAASASLHQIFSSLK